MEKKRLTTNDLFNILKRLEKSQKINLQSLSRLEEEWQQLQSSKTAYVTSAVALTEEEKNELALSLGFIHGTNFVIRNKVDSQVIGGLKIQVGSLVIDTTIQSQLEKIKQSLIENGEK
jgi:F-type H+-transporting ATPase subunit delta